MEARGQYCRDVLRAIFEGRRSLKQMGLTDPDLRIAYCLFEDARDWSVSSLSEATALSRVTVRAHLAIWRKLGFVVKRPAGYRITEAGAACIKHTMDRFLEDNRAILRKLCVALRAHR